jgi:hypothetical protein
MIRVRYRDSNELSPGLHAAAERHGRTTTVYLLSGLTKPQRQSALRRLRLSARMGHCPGLPAGQLALALFADRIRTGIGRAGAVLRLHPAGSTLPVMVLSGGAIAFLLFSAVSIRVLRTTPASPEVASSPGPVASAGAGAVRFAGSQGGVTGLGGSGDRQAIPPALGGSSLATGPSLAGAGPNAVPGSGGNGSGQGGNGTGQGGNGTGGSTGSGTSRGSGGGTTLSGGTDPAPAPSQGGGTGSGTGSGGSSSSSPPSKAQAAPSASAPPPAPSATQAASSGLCVKIGPLGLCLKG